MQEDRTLGNRWWFAVPTLTLLLLAPTLFHGQPFLYWDTGQYYHYGAQLVGFATTRIGTIMQLNALGPSEIAKEQGPGNLNEAGGRATTAANSFDNAMIAQKSQAGGMATYVFGRVRFHPLGCPYCASCRGRLDYLACGHPRSGGMPLKSRISAYCA